MTSWHQEFSSTGEETFVIGEDPDLVFTVEHPGSGAIVEGGHPFDIHLCRKSSGERSAAPAGTLSGGKMRRKNISRMSAHDATLATGGWLDLTRQGLSLCKMHQASPGALMPQISSFETALTGSTKLEATTKR